MEITAQCTCGKDLSQSEVKLEYSEPVIVVEPCEDCMTEEDEKGYKRGFEDGEQE